MPELFKACLLPSDTRALKLLDNKDCQVNWVHPVTGETALMVACRSRLNMTARAIIRTGNCLPLQVSKNNDTAILWAIYGDLLWVVKDLIAAGCDINHGGRGNASLPRGFSALKLALVHNRYEMAIMLLDAGCEFSTDLFEQEYKAFCGLRINPTYTKDHIRVLFKLGGYPVGVPLDVERWCSIAKTRTSPNLLRAAIGAETEIYRLEHKWEALRQVRKYFQVQVSYIVCGYL
jgi:hypothetical protein